MKVSDEKWCQLDEIPALLLPRRLRWFGLAVGHEEGELMRCLWGTKLPTAWPKKRNLGLPISRRTCHSYWASSSSSSLLETRLDGDAPWSVSRPLKLGFRCKGRREGKRWGRTTRPSWLRQQGHGPAHSAHCGVPVPMAVTQMIVERPQRKATNPWLPSEGMVVNTTQPRLCFSFWLGNLFVACWC